MASKKPSKSSLAKKADDLWSLLIKVKAKHRCEYCGKTTGLNSHHIFSRVNKSVRWDDLNGICLCAGHHALSSNFSAHLTPTEFTEWIKDYRGKAWYKSLRQRAYTPAQPNFSLITEDLKRKLSDYERA